MGLVAPQYQKDLEGVIKDAAKAAMLATFELSVSEEETADSIKEKVSKAFADKFTEKFAKDFSVVTTNYLKTMTLVPVLVAGPYPVVGTITVT